MLIHCEGTWVGTIFSVITWQALHLKQLFQVMIIIPIFINEKIRLRGIKLESKTVLSKPIMSYSTDYALFVLRTWDLETIFGAAKASTEKRAY